MKRSTLLLGLVLVGLSAYIYRFERDAVETNHRTPLFDVPTDSVVAIELLTQAPAEREIRDALPGPIRLERSHAGPHTDTDAKERGDDTSKQEQEPSGGWRLSTPVVAVADGAEIELLLENLVSIAFERVVRNDLGESPHELSPFGLDAPSPSVRLSLESGETLGVDFGARTPTEHNRYARRLNGTEILSVPAFTSNNFEKSVWDLRSKQVFQPVFGGAVTRIESSNPEGATWALEKETNSWRLSAPLSAIADRYTGGALATRLAELQMTSVLAESASDAELAELGLNPPHWEIRIGLGPDLDAADARPAGGGDGEVATRILRIGRAQQEGYVAQADDRKTVFTVEKTFVEQELSRNHRDWISKKFLDLPVLEIQKIEIDWNGIRHDAEKRRNADAFDWYSLADPEIRLENKSIEDFLYRFNGLSAKSVSARLGQGFGETSPGFESSVIQATIRIWGTSDGRENTPPFSISLNRSDEALWAVRDEEPFALQFDPSVWETLESLLPFSALDTP